jgi:hypothetical protein
MTDCRSCLIIDIEILLDANQEISVEIKFIWSCVNSTMQCKMVI